MEKRKILFLCTGNSCRSQMAEGIAREDGWESCSAGTKPEIKVNPFAVNVMAEMGIDISHQTTDQMDDFLDKEIDIVITLSNSARDLCSVFHGKVEQLHWDVPDPFPGWVDDSHFLPKFREVRNIIRGYIGTFFQSY